MREIATSVFALAALGFLADRLAGFQQIVLQGLRRFQVVAALSLSVTVLRAVGIVVVLQGGRGLVSVMVWQVIASIAGLITAIEIVSRIETSLGFRIAPFSWAVLTRHVRFSVLSQLNALAGKVIWEMPPVIVGLVLGSASVATYYVAQKFPIAVTTLIWAAAAALFPAAAQAKGEHPAAVREVLEVGTRWIVLLALPICLLLWTLAPTLLRVWVGSGSPDAVLLMRLIVVAVLAEGIGAGSLGVLWGSGEIAVVFAILASVAAASIALALWLLPTMGITGAGWALVVPVSAGTVAAVLRACDFATMGVTKLVAKTAHGLVLPSLACYAASASIPLIFPGGRWPVVIATAVLGFGVFASVLFLWGAREEERALAREIRRFPRTVLDFILRRPAIGNAAVRRTDRCG